MTHRPISAGSLFVLAGLLFAARPAVLPAQPAAATGHCNVIVDNEGHSETKDVSAFQFPTSVRFFIRATTPTCSSVVLTASHPSWIHIHATQGNHKGVNDGIAFQGSGAFVVEMKANPGPSGRQYVLQVRDATFTRRVQIYQGIKQPCVNTYTALDASTWLRTDLTPGYVILSQNFPAPSPPTTAPYPIQFRFRDTTHCAAYPVVMYHSTNDFQAEVFRTGNDYLVRSRPVPPSDNGAAAVLRMQTGLSGVATILTRKLAELPPDLQVSKQTMDLDFVSIGSSGGQVEISGHVKRPHNNPNRGCIFAPALYRSSDPAIQVSPESGCKASDPDAGTLVIRALPNTQQARYSLVFTGWGYAFWVIQPGGG